MRHVLQRLARGLFRRLFRVELRGWEHYPHDEPRLLIVANHVSYLDGALLAAFLPDVPMFVINTHMARHWWVKPFIAVTRHISIDPTNSHYLKTLIQHLKAGERVAVFPEGRISFTGALMKIYEGPALAADKANAALLPVYIEGAQYSLLSRLGGMVRQRLLPRIRLTMLPPRRLTATGGNGRARRRQLGRQLDELMVELAYAGMNIDQPLAAAMLETWERQGGRRVILEDAQEQRLGWRALFARAFILAELLEAEGVSSPLPPGEGQGVRVGLLLPNAAAAVVGLLALHLCGRTPVVLNFTAGIHDLISACHTAQARTVVTSRAFVETASLQPQVAALSQQVRVLFLEDLRPRATLPVRLRGLARALAPGWSFRRGAGPVRAGDPNVNRSRHRLSSRDLSETANHLAHDPQPLVGRHVLVELRPVESPGPLEVLPPDALEVVARERLHRRLLLRHAASNSRQQRRHCHDQPHSSHLPPPLGPPQINRQYASQTSYC